MFQVEYKAYYGLLEEQPKMGKEKDQGWFETNKHGKIEDKRDKRGWLRVKGCLVNILV